MEEVLMIIDTVVHRSSPKKYVEMLASTRRVSAVPPREEAARLSHPERVRILNLRCKGDLK